MVQDVLFCWNWDYYVPKNAIYPIAIFLVGGIDCRSVNGCDVTALGRHSRTVAISIVCNNESLVRLFNSQRLLSNVYKRLLKFSNKRYYKHFLFFLLERLLHLCVTSSSAVAKRPRDASCLSVVSFNSTKRRVESFIVSYIRRLQYRFVTACS